MASNSHDGRIHATRAAAPAVPTQRVPPSEWRPQRQHATGTRGPGALTVIVPTRNEARNVGPLLERLGGTLRGWDADRPGDERGANPTDRSLPGP